MAEPFKFELVSPERLLVSEDVESVVIPGTEGDMTVMAKHAPVMTSKSKKLCLSIRRSYCQCRAI